jgi:2-oxoisovalerate dehydrogenase E1 component alpha subunit
LKKNIFNKSEVETVWQDTEENVNKAIKEAEKAPPPPIESIFDDVFDEIPPFLQEQKDMLMEELKRRRIS